MSRQEIKAQAKSMIKGNKWNIWKPMLVYTLISFAASLIGETILTEDSMAASIVSLIVSVATIPLTYGLSLYFLHFIRNEEFSLNDLFACYPSIVRLFLISLLTGIFVCLWSFLFIIPGIIAAFAYSMVSFIAVDNKDLSALEVIKKSKEIMKGHKWEYFVFELSFIGWYILAPFTLGILYIWLLPYVAIADALFYENIS